MCLILFAYNYHPDYSLVLAANRDEFYSRPTEPLAFRGPSNNLLCGLDLEGGGTWLGAGRNGRIAALTNFREPEPHGPGAPSRGLLVSDSILTPEPLARHLEKTMAQAGCYNGFNLLAADSSGLYYCSNRSAKIRRLQAGLYGLSNHLLDTAWPKVSAGKDKLRAALAGPDEPDPEALFSLLRDDSLPPETLLPDTGIGQAWEKILAPIFIKSAVYGTRSSSLMLLKKNGRLRFIERTYAASASEELQGTCDFSFTIAPW